MFYEIFETSTPGGTVMFALEFSDGPVPFGPTAQTGSGGVYPTIAEAVAALRRVEAQVGEKFSQTEFSL